jgi:hypothetical protein
MSITIDVDDTERTVAILNAALSIASEDLNAFAKHDLLIGYRPPSEGEVHALQDAIWFCDPRHDVEVRSAWKFTINSDHKPAPWKEVLDTFLADPLIVDWLCHPIQVGDEYTMSPGYVIRRCE